MNPRTRRAKFWNGSDESRVFNAIPPPDTQPEARISLPSMLSYHSIDSSPAEEWLDLLNSEQVRRHLIDHPRFTPETLPAWLRSKLLIDQTPGCRVRAIHAEGSLVGWCGIQIESGAHEIALVLSPGSWGQGREVMNEILKWAREFGHEELLAYLPQTRTQSRALERLFGRPAGSIEIQGRPFHTYRIEVRSRKKP